ncbi:MAG: dipeptide epimerase [Gammaproteobacteria bacterium]|nr:dipeptide epimerase [Gammaproteobacteria bacterium]MCY4220017.1 dipeptide epimerase [Gammaproteobacteria bacterium]MCY4275118.1 dipeptide epimerase [Gammaproteobacteria bacterium]
MFLKKRFPLKISRGIIRGTENLFIGITKENITGWGELSPGMSEGAATVESARDHLESFLGKLQNNLSIHEVTENAREHQIPLCALAGLDIALWDWLGKKANLPLYRLLGIGLPTAPTSVTIGINPLHVIKERIPEILQGNRFKALKIKLGSPEGIEADQAMFCQVLVSTKPYDVKLRVDANGGWNTDDAIRMMKWIVKQAPQTEYVEQPLQEGQESELPKLFKGRPLPIFVDESCRVSSDIPKWSTVVDGVNLKLMKCGGITEGLRIIATARAFGLKTMIGCMGESSMSISAGAAISGLVDYIDLDSHLNLDPDPCFGATLVDGITTPNQNPGHGTDWI